jgi:hypothetical protein
MASEPFVGTRVALEVIRSETRASEVKVTRARLRGECIMCGIMGYIGSNPATPHLLAGLAQLEYRGYDSAGVALLSEFGELRIEKVEGRLSKLEPLLRTANGVPPGKSRQPTRRYTRISGIPRKQVGQG